MFPDLGGLIKTLAIFAGIGVAALAALAAWGLWLLAHWIFA